ncbi:HAT dimerization [Penicillium viridicatum]|nr:HAT dimerization [Penicillium viridicatum]
MALMKTRDVIIYSVFLVYRKLLEYIERALLVARQKLKEYYEKTYCDYGFLYGTRILLAPYTELNRLLEPPSASIFYEGVEYNEVDQYLREGTSNQYNTLEQLTDLE